MAETNDRMAAALQETFEDLREKSEQFTRPCTIALSGQAALVLSQKPYKEMLGSWVTEELLKRYAASGDRAGELLEHERPHLTTERGNPPTISFELSRAPAIPTDTPKESPKPRKRKPMKARR